MMAPCLTTYDDTLLACLALFVAYLIYQTLTSLNAPHPPGPRPCPFIYARHQSIHNPSVPGPTTLPEGDNSAARRIRAEFNSPS
jgi:hypothetical protein